MFHPREKFQLSPKLKLGVGRGFTTNKALKYGASACLIIAAGLTLNALKIMFTHHDSGNSLTVPQVLGASDTKTSAAYAPEVQFIQYTVQKGDTLFDISQKFNIEWTTLATLNNIQSPFTVKAGQILNIPK